MARQQTRGEIYNAIRAADAAGDSEAVKRLAEYVQTIPLVHVEPEAPQAGPNPITDIGASMVKGVPDVALSLVRGAVAQPIAGVAGTLAAPFVGADRAANVVRDVGSFVTGEPFSDIGKAGMANIAKPISYFVDRVADRPGEAVASFTGSPAAGAAMNTAIQAIPALIAPEARGAFGSVARGGARAVRDFVSPRALEGGVPLVDNSVPPITPPKPAELAPEQLDELIQEHGIGFPTMTHAERALDQNRIFAFNEMDEVPSEVTSVEMLRNYTPDRLVAVPRALFPDTAGGADAAAAPIMTRAPAAASTATMADPAAAKAAAYAGSLGLDWNALATPIRDKLTRLAAGATDLSQLDGAAIAREAKLASLPVPVPATRGMLRRNAAELRTEGNVAATDAGAPIAAVHDAGNQALLDNLDVLKGRVSGTGAAAAVATTPEEAGGAVQGAVRGKQLLAKAKTKAAYALADESPEAQVKVDTSGIRDLIAKLPDADQFKYAKGWLERNTQGAGSGTKVIDLQELRKLATRKAKNGGEDALYAHDLMAEIDKATEAVAGPLYKSARAAHIAERTEFGDQAAVRSLVENDSRTDRATALEGTVRSITTGSLEDIRAVKRSLLTGDDASSRAAGKQAWREVRARIVQGIKDDATKGVATLADGSPNLTPAALKRAIDAYGPAKLDELLGAGTAKHVYRILDAAVDVKTSPPLRGAVGSSTLANVLTFLEKGLTKVPVLGDVSVGAVKAGQKLHELGSGAKLTRKAVESTPLSEAVGRAASKARRDTNYRDIRATGPAAITVSELAAQAAKKDKRR